MIIIITFVPRNLTWQFSNAPYNKTTEYYKYLKYNNI